MPHWRYREELSAQNRLRRSIYELLRDQLDQQVLSYTLIDSYKRFVENRQLYPFVEKRELKPRARIPQQEYEHQSAFLILFVEDTIPSAYKKYIRFFDANKTTKANLINAKAISLNQNYDRNLRYMESLKFFDFLKTLLPVDYALLIQRDPATRARNRYSMTHFHVRVDWPIADAAEDLARHLRYISKDLYEKGDAYAEDLQKKFFEYYGVPTMSGGRRTAGIVAAQFLRRLNCISTIYVGSSESRALLRISEQGISKSILMKLTGPEMTAIAESAEMSLSTFKKNYLVAREGSSGIAVFRASYAHTSHARPPEDGKLRDLKSDVHWLTVESQHLLPAPNVWRFAPLPCNIIYT
ncbi:MAG: hypothetical protein JRI97_06610 [Deltaproteobacteria bacterium]|nr:hypothetical protein [Deltaproteobacteria bacterium]